MTFGVLQSQLPACVSHPDNWEQRSFNVGRVNHLRVVAVALVASIAGDSMVNVALGRGFV